MIDWMRRRLRKDNIERAKRLLDRATDSGITDFGVLLGNVPLAGGHRFEVQYRFADAMGNAVAGGRWGEIPVVRVDLHASYGPAFQFGTTSGIGKGHLVVSLYGDGRVEARAIRSVAGGATSPNPLPPIETRAYDSPEEAVADLPRLAMTLPLHQEHAECLRERPELDLVWGVPLLGSPVMVMPRERDVAFNPGM